MMLTRLTKLTCFFALLAMVALATNSNAAIIWTGAVDGDITNDGNYDFSGSGLATVAGIQGPGGTFVGVADDIAYNNSGTAPEIPNVSSQQRFGTTTGGGFSLTFDGVISTFAGGSNEGWTGTTVSLINGASTDSFFYIESAVSIDATSSMILRGGGNPVNIATIDMAPGAVVTFTAETVAQFNGEHLGKFFVNGSPLVDGVNATIVSDGGSGSVITAIVPEPGTLALAGLALAGLVAVRRRRS